MKRILCVTLLGLAATSSARAQVTVALTSAGQSGHTKSVRVSVDAGASYQPVSAGVLIATDVGPSGVHSTFAVNLSPTGTASPGGVYTGVAAPSIDLIVPAASPSLPGAGLGVNPDAPALLDSLFDRYLGFDDDSGAAFQLAVWDIVIDGG